MFAVKVRPLGRGPGRGDDDSAPAWSGAAPVARAGFNRFAALGFHGALSFGADDREFGAL